MSSRQNYRFMKLHEATTFLTAFKHEDAKVLVRTMMVHNYTEAILEHHPQSHGLNKEEIYEKCTRLCHSIFREIEKIQEEPEQLLPLLIKLSRNNRPLATFWFEEFNLAYKWYKHGHKLKIKAGQLAPYLSGETYCDIGCGGGDLVAYLKKYHPHFKTYTGIDVLDWRTDHLKNEINFQLLDFSKPDARSTQQYDMATCIAALHHIGDTYESRHIFLHNIRRALKENGRLLIEEDVILPSDELAVNGDYKNQTELLAKDQSHFSEYLAMSREEQKSVLTIIDLLANSLIVGVPNMAFPFGFKSIEEWCNIFIKSRYTIEHVKIHGFTKGMFNCSSHVFFILRPT